MSITIACPSLTPTDNTYIVHHVLPFDVYVPELKITLGRHDTLARAKDAAQWATQVLAELYKDDALSVAIRDRRNNRLVDWQAPEPAFVELSDTAEDAEEAEDENFVNARDLDEHAEEEAVEEAA